MSLHQQWAIYFHLIEPHHYHTSRLHNNNILVVHIDHLGSRPGQSVFYHWQYKAPRQRIKSTFCQTQWTYLYFCQWLDKNKSHHPWYKISLVLLRQFRFLWDPVSGNWCPTKPRDRNLQGMRLGRIVLRWLSFWGRILEKLLFDVPDYFRRISLFHSGWKVVTSPYLLF